MVVTARVCACVECINREKATHIAIILRLLHAAVFCFDGYTALSTLHLSSSDCRARLRFCADCTTCNISGARGPTLDSPLNVC